MLWFGETVSPCDNNSPNAVTHIPLPASLLHSPSRGTLSPAELPRVIHVWPRLDVAFFWVIDGGGSGISSSQDEHKAIEGDSRCILVVCENGRGRRSRHVGLPPLLSQQCFQWQYVTDCLPGQAGNRSSLSCIDWLALSRYWHPHCPLGFGATYSPYLDLVLQSHWT